MVWLELINQWIDNYLTYPFGKTELTNQFGSITFIKESNNFKKLLVYEIYINGEYRKKGLCKQFLTQLIDCIPINCTQIIIQAVLSKILYEYLERFEYKGKKFKIYKCEWTLKI